MRSVVNKFCDYYQDLNLEKLSQLDELYNGDAVFIDPLHSIKGLVEITHYFEQMIINVTDCRFQIVDVLETDGQAFITWIMSYSHPKLNQGNTIELAGSSHLKFNAHIIYHRDYYDVGQMLYEHIPVLKYFIAKIKQRLTS